ncbi:hypothetical protein B1H19_08540 [Streptomyces gilvosporeus]|uniref:Uncharacterized protein n=1 Tax=Streptomyces gilvosporeus TaxID=553510 RepID=A0A1V0TMQ4_9ACTN|nr:hypothetical protein B1H19_08540 [Streptomyces gilvosporeus]
MVAAVAVVVAVGTARRRDAMPTGTSRGRERHVDGIAVQPASLDPIFAPVVSSGAPGLIRESWS